MKERRQGRHVHYSLTSPEFAEWLLDGLKFLEGELEHQEGLRTAVKSARSLWMGEDGS